MKLSDVDFKNGNSSRRILEDLNFDLTLESQQDSLIEDICQIEYENGYLMDIGWYPESMEISKESRFKVYIIRDHDWEKPISLYYCADLNELKKCILEAVDKIVQLKFG